MNLRRLLQYWTRRLFAPDRLLRQKYEAFKELLRHDKRSLELISELEELGYAGAVADWAAVPRLISALDWSVGSLIRALSSMRPGGYKELEQRHGQLSAELAAALPVFAAISAPPYALGMAHAAGQAEMVGGKAAALGRVLQAGFRSLAALSSPPGPSTSFLPITTCATGSTNCWRRCGLHDEADRLQELSREMTAMIRQAEVPVQVREAIAENLAELRRAWLLRPVGPAQQRRRRGRGKFLCRSVCERDGRGPGGYPGAV